MILMDIKGYFSRNRMASLADLSVHFGIELDAMRGMLEQWIRKRKLRKLAQEKSCWNCCEACKADQLEIYQWLE